MEASGLLDLLWWALLSVTVVAAANSVNITGAFSTPQECFQRQTGSVPLTSLSSTIVTTNVGCVRATDVPGLRSLVTWKSVVPANLTLGNYSADVSWIQPSYFPDLSGGTKESTPAASATFEALRDLCIVQCSVLLPNAASFVMMLAYGACFCDVSAADYSLTPAVRSLCCDPLPLTVANDTDPRQQQPVANGTNVLALVPRPPSCPVALFGLYVKVFFTCQLNASVCGASSGSCNVQNGCCMPNAAPNSMGNLATVEGAAAQWLISLLLVAVIFQLAYWVVRLRMCRNDDGPERQTGAGGAAPLERSLRRRGASRREGGGEADGDTEMLEQLQGIANRVRLVLLQRHAQMAEPRRTKEEAADAALEALSLFDQCDQSTVSSDDCCPMCLDELRLKQCIRVLCGHVIHQDCMRDFLAHKLVSYRTPVTCPMCRATVLYQTSAPASGSVAGDEGAGGRQTGAEGAEGGARQPLLVGDEEVDAAAATNQPPLAAGDSHTPQGRSGRQRSSSRGRRFRVAQANLAVERLLEHRTLGATSTYEPPLLGAAEREGGAALEGEAYPRQTDAAATIVVEGDVVPSVPPLDVGRAQQEVALLPMEFAGVVPLVLVQEEERPPHVVELNVNEL